MKPLGSIVDLKVVADRIKQWIKYEIYATTPVPLYCQTAVPYCSAAVGRMIAAYYGVYHSEAHVASVMSITQQHWPTADDELKYYKSAQGLKKANSVKYESLAYLKNWTNYKNELQAGRPSSLRTGWHSHVLAGIRVRTSAPGVQLVDIGLVDPFPADNCPKSQSCNTYKIPKCKGGAWEPFYFRKTVWKAHVIPKD